MSNVSQELRKLENKDGGITISFQALLEQFKIKGFGFLILILSLPSALPIPAPGYSTPLGICIMCLAIQLLLGLKTPWLPRKLLHKNIVLSQKLLTLAYKCLRWVEYFSKNGRCKHLDKIFNQRIIGLNILILAFIMALPIPLTNTFPAAIIFVFGFGLLENDGLFLLLAQILSLLAIFAYTFAAFWIAYFGIESLIHLFS